MYHMDLQKAERCASDRRLEEGENICQAILAERPDHVGALRVMADIRIRERNPEECIRFAEEALALDADDPKLYNLRGRARNNLGMLEDAETDFRRALQLDPRFADAHSNLGHILRRKGYAEAAEQCFRKALARDANHGLANLNIGTILFERGQVRKAIQHLQRGLDEEMTNLAGRYNLAIAQHQIGHLSEAVHNYRQVIANGQTDPDAFSNMAAALQALGDLEGAAAGFETALEANPDHGPSLAGLAGLFELSGQYDKGIDLLRPHLRRGNAAPMVHVAYARLLRCDGRGKEALVHLAPLAKVADLSRHQKLAIHFTLGDLLDDLGEHDRAFAHYEMANRLRKVDYNSGMRKREVDNLIQVFSQENLDRMPDSGRDTEQPVFIVGMPRSGTSLVEQILASHPEIEGAGELRDIGLISIDMGRNKEQILYPECVLQMDRQELRGWSKQYLEKLARFSRHALRITDKMWQNFEHIGLIQLMFPKARIIHCRRSPLDTGLSCFFQSFGTAGPPFSYDLKNIGAYYNEYRRLMNHWQDVSSLAMLEIDYEDLVQDIEGNSRRMVEFLGLEWDPECLRFYENPRLVRTASHAQVRRPAYTSSIGRAIHYRDALGPMIEEMEQAGYL